jgi:hypothetical protein
MAKASDERAPVARVTVGEIPPQAGTSRRRGDDKESRSVTPLVFPFGELTHGNSPRMNHPEGLSHP